MTTKFFLATGSANCALCTDPIRKGDTVGYLGSMLVHYLCANYGPTINVDPSSSVASKLEQFMPEDEALKIKSRINKRLRKGHEPFEFQYVGPWFIDQHAGRALIADEMGLGKTIQALAWLADHPEYRPVVIVAPASVTLNWIREVKRWLKRKGTNKKTGREYAEINQVRYLYSNPQFWAKQHNMKKIKLHRTGVYVIGYDVVRKWLPQLMDLHPQAVILDECHYIKNKSALRTKAIVGSRAGVHKTDDFLLKGVPHVVALSGTPLTNRPQELWTTINALRPDVFSNWFQFVKKYCKAQKTRWGYDTTGASNLEELGRELRKHVMIRREKADVLKDLPPKTRSTMPLDIVNRKEYQLAERNLIAWLREIGADQDQIAGAMRAEALVRIGKLKQLAARGKYLNVVSWVKDFMDSTEQENGKLVFFAHHRKIIDLYKEAFKDYGLVTITGADTVEDRQKAIDAFQEGTPRIALVSLKAGSTGITLHRASNVVFAELGWTPGEHNQAEDRIHRIGQAEHCTAYYLLAAGTIEERIASLIDSKRHTMETVLGDEHGAAVGDILSELVADLLREYTTAGRLVKMVGETKKEEDAA